MDWNSTLHNDLSDLKWPQGLCCSASWVARLGSATCCCSWVWRVHRAPGSGRSSARWAEAPAHPGPGRWTWRWCRRAVPPTAEAGWTVPGLKGKQEVQRSKRGAKREWSCRPPPVAHLQRNKPCVCMIYLSHKSTTAKEEKKNVSTRLKLSAVWQYDNVSENLACPWSNSLNIYMWKYCIAFVSQSLIYPLKRKDTSFISCPSVRCCVLPFFQSSARGPRTMRVLSFFSPVTLGPVRTEPADSVWRSIHLSLPRSPASILSLSLSLPPPSPSSSWTGLSEGWRSVRGRYRFATSIGSGPDCQHGPSVLLLFFPPCVCSAFLIWAADTPAPPPGAFACWLFPWLICCTAVLVWSVTVSQEFWPLPPPPL